MTGNVLTDIVLIFVGLLSAIITGLTPKFIAIISAWLDGKKLFKASAAMKDLQTECMNTADLLYQRFVQGWKEANGKLTDVQIKQLMVDSVAITKNHLMPGTLNVLESAGKDVNALILDYVDSYLGSQKGVMLKPLPLLQDATCEGAGNE